VARALGRGAKRAPLPSAPGATAGLEERLAETLVRYGPYLDQCRERMRSRLPGAPLHAALRRHVEGGKLTRGLLVLLTGSSVGGEPRDLLPGAEALELLHAASLIHDDLVDGAATRRGVPALHEATGAAVALVLGDYLVLAAFGALTAGSDDPVRLQAAERLSAYACECCLGEADELLADGNTSPEEYLAIVRAKTAAPFAAAATLGVLLGGGDPGEVEAAHDFGLALGTAFQIRDDVLDLVGDPATLLPLVLVLSDGSPAVRRRARSLAQQGRRAEIVALMEHEGALAQTERIQAEHAEAALEALARFARGPDADALADVVDFAVARER